MECVSACVCVCVCVVLGQSLQYSRKKNRLLSFLQNPEVDEEDDVQSLCVLRKRRKSKR